MDKVFIYIILLSIIILNDIIYFRYYNEHKEGFIDKLKKFWKEFKTGQLIEKPVVAGLKGFASVIPSPVGSYLGRRVRAAAPSNTWGMKAAGEFLFGGLFAIFVLVGIYYIAFVAMYNLVIYGFQFVIFMVKTFFKKMFETPIISGFSISSSSNVIDQYSKKGLYR